ncbi:MAG: glycosyltransferase family 2 protein [Verrucomicrobiota bacterium]
MNLTEFARWRRRVWSSLHMRRLTPRTGSPPPGPVLFAMVRNEMLRLPRFLQHYRALGVARFYFVANNCTDETVSYLRKQADVVLYETTETFVRKEAWIDLLLRRHGVDRWCLVVDADELLDYPDAARAGLAELCAYFDGRRDTALHAILLDLYPATPLEEVAYESGSDFFDIPWYFDPPESLHKVPRAFYKGSGLDHRLEGGSRERLFGVKNCCSKFPLFRYHRGMFLSDGQHYIEGARISSLRSVLYHFKYLQDFAPHVREEIERGQHWRGAHEYKIYARVLQDRKTGLVFLDDRSIRYENAAQLETLGLIVRPADFPHA